MLKSFSFALTLFLLAGCASTPGAKPHDMSVEQHEAAANTELNESEQHEGQFDPEAKERETRCNSPHPNAGPCWTALKNPTEPHRKDADEHRRAAADHRAASQALKTAEAQACAGIPDADRDMSPFDHREDIASVQPLNEATTLPKGSEKLVGATIAFRALPGMTAQWLQRVVDCHIARNAALGHVVPEMPSCPLVPKGVTASVTATSDGFAVAVRATDAETAQEVLRRASSLKSH